MRPARAVAAGRQPPPDADALTGLVGYRRDGKHNYYHLAPGFMRELLEQFFSDSGNGQRQLQFDDFALSYKRR